LLIYDQLLQGKTGLMKKSTAGGVNLKGKVKELDIAQNLKTIEWLKAELVDSMAALFKALLQKGNDAIQDAASTIIIITYLLTRRVGVTYSVLDQAIKDKLSTSIKESEETGSWSGDLSELFKYLESKKRW
ncbi:MAG: MazG-like family protein, partial [Syntrophomonas sp.]|nr:MazG-like family protein [Syntrophomonas sp.]